MKNRENWVLNRDNEKKTKQTKQHPDSEKDLRDHKIQILCSTRSNSRKVIEICLMK